MSQSSWNFCVELTPQLLKTTDPLPWLVETLGVWLGPGLDRSRLFTVLSELYHNALDHGILGLNSGLKRDAAGYASYYEQRRQRLAALEEGSIKISLAHDLTRTGGLLHIQVTDSGEGFVPRGEVEHSPNAFSGRGMALLKALCSGLKIAGRGNSVQVTMSWTASLDRHS